MITLSEKTVEWLFKLSRQSIEYFFETKNFLPYEKISIPKECKEEVSVLSGGFILLELPENEQRKAYIRGENGMFERVEELGKLVSQIAVNAAFFDSRTPRLKIYEMNELKIHLLIPSENIPVHGTYGEILAKLESMNGGIVLETRGRLAHDLPDILEQHNETVGQRVRRLRLRLGVKKENAEKMIDYYFFSVQHYKEQ